MGMHARTRALSLSLSVSHLTLSLGQALGVSRALQHLSVARNSICAPGATCFANALYDGHFVTLESLGLRQNNIGRYAARCGSFVCVGVWGCVVGLAHSRRLASERHLRSRAPSQPLAFALALSLKRTLALPLQPPLSAMDKDVIELWVYTRQANVYTKSIQVARNCDQGVLPRDAGQAGGCVH